MEFLCVSAPGRICLFGEHSDYMKLPVITAAINLRIRISGTPRKDTLFNISLPDINDFEIFDAKEKIPYTKPRDYFRSVVNVVRRKGVNIKYGFDCEVHGEIPMQGGCSSSSALVVMWAKFLLTAFDSPLANDPNQIAMIGYEAEVLEFNEPGGWMDHFATALGGIGYFDCGVEPPVIKRLPAKLGKFVVGDSLQPKDTIGFLKRLRFGRLDILKKLEPEIYLEDLRHLQESQIEKFRNKIPPEEFLLLKGTIVNKDYVNEGLQVLSKTDVDVKRLGLLFDLQHQLLRNIYKTSTEKIDKMLSVSRNAGAYGGKISGSGGGGCMFVYAPETFMQVARAIREVGGKPFIVDVASGVKVDELF